MTYENSSNGYMESHTIHACFGYENTGYKITSFTHAQRFTKLLFPNSVTRFIKSSNLKINSKLHGPLYIVLEWIDMAVIVEPQVNR